MTFRDLFGETRPLIGMVHLPALPGSPRWGGSMDEVLATAVRDARILVDEGIDAVLIENFGDAPFFPDVVPPETIAALAVAAAVVRAEVNVPVGVNVLRNDARAALGIAAATEAAFIRVNVHVGAMVADQGLLVGHAHDTLRARTMLQTDTLIFADVLVKHATPLGKTDLGLYAEDAAYRGLADALLVTGASTGRAADLADIREVKAAVGSVPVLAASGVTDASVAEILAVADGAIVGTWLKQDGRTTAAVDPARVRALLRARGRLRVTPVAKKAVRKVAAKKGR